VFAEPQVWCDGAAKHASSSDRASELQVVRAVRCSLAGWLTDEQHHHQHYYHPPPPITTLFITATHPSNPPVCHSRKTRCPIHQHTHRHPFLRPAAATACSPAATHPIATHLAAHATQHLQEPERGSTSPPKCPPSHRPRVWWASCPSPTLPFRLSRLRGSTRRLTACGLKSLDLLDKCEYAARVEYTIGARLGFDCLPRSDGWSSEARSRNLQGTTLTLHSQRIPFRK
jgi:hypothetical protein